MKKDRIQTIKIPNKHVNSGDVVFLPFTNTEPLLSFEGPIESDGELKLHLSRMGVFWATVLRKTDPVPIDSKNDDIKVSAFDPGVRTFNTEFDN